MKTVSDETWPRGTVEEYVLKSAIKDDFEYDVTVLH